MKIIDVLINPSYSCNVCQKTFQVKIELNLNFMVICSKKCEFKFIYRLLKKQGYTQANLKQLLRIIKKEQLKEEINENLAIYEITKHYHKIGLSNIKHLGSRLIAKAQGSREGTKAQGSSKTPPIYRGDEPELEPTISVSSNNNLSLSNFGGINK